MDSHRIVRLILPFSTFVVVNDNMHGNPLAEIVPDNPSKDFLQDGIMFLRMEIHYTDGVFQFPERCLNAPYADILKMPINASKKCI